VIFCRLLFKDDTGWDHLTIGLETLFRVLTPSSLNMCLAPVFALEFWSWYLVEVLTKSSNFGVAHGLWSRPVQSPQLWQMSLMAALHVMHFFVLFAGFSSLRPKGLQTKGQKSIDIPGTTGQIWCSSGDPLATPKLEKKDPEVSCDPRCDTGTGHDSDQDCSEIRLDESVASG
jgi:hypothetical protein